MGGVTPKPSLWCAVCCFEQKEMGGVTLNRLFLIFFPAQLKDIHQGKHGNQLQSFSSRFKVTTPISFCSKQQSTRQKEGFGVMPLIAGQTTFFGNSNFYSEEELDMLIKMYKKFFGY